MGNALDAAGLEPVKVAGKFAQLIDSQEPKWNPAKRRWKMLPDFTAQPHCEANRPVGEPVSGRAAQGRTGTGDRHRECTAVRQRNPPGLSGLAEF